VQFYQRVDDVRRRREVGIAHAEVDHIATGGDPFELTTARPLDFGHWSAHKLEPMTNFELRHGEAVAIGVAVDTVYSSLVHGFPEEDAERVLNCLARLGLDLDHPALHETHRLFAGLEEFRQHLYAPDMHEPELLIRTGGERRLSNYLLWQVAFAELVFREELLELIELLRQLG
jgi:hypothetical protein